ncbi:hypothetical protein OSTOST_02972, partial [Ostertagia ostertagi]
MLRELQLKVLQNLRRSDVNRCRLVNRETLELICCNEQLMRRRVIERLLLRETEYGDEMQMRVQCSEEGIDEPMFFLDDTKEFVTTLPRRHDFPTFCSLPPPLPSILPKMTRNAEVCLLEIQK